MSHSPLPSSLRESYYSYSGESEPESFPKKTLLEIGGYDDSVEPVSTKEEAVEYLKQLAFEEEEEQILLSRFFRGGRHQRLVCFLCYEIQTFDNTTRENKRYD